MIVRRPGTWGTMSGEAMDDGRNGEAIGMAGLQQQHAKVVELSGTGSSSSCGWGTCAELLLVSAVKKHGVPNWNLVSLELKARAIPLNIPPSCFTDEACRFKYNALKGKFASSSGGGVSSLDDEVNGVSWFEELRKLRMSHLKEELQVYDSSIGQLQSRISELKEERARCLSLQSVMKQYDNSCGVDTSYPKSCKTSDVKVSIPTRRPEENSETPQGLALKDSVQPDFPAGQLGTDSLDRQQSFGTAREGHECQKDGPVTLPTKRAQLAHGFDRRKSSGNTQKGHEFQKDDPVPFPTEFAQRSTADLDRQESSGTAQGVYEFQKDGPVTFPTKPARVATDGLDQRKSSGLVGDGHEVQKDGPVTSRTKLASQDPLDEVKEMVDLTTGQESTPESDGPGEKAAGKDEHQVGTDGESEAHQAGESETRIIQDPSPERCAATSDQPTVERPSGTPCSVGVLLEGVTPAGDDGFVVSDDQASVGVHSRVEGKLSEGASQGGTESSLPGSISTNTEADWPKEHPCPDLPEVLVATSEVPSRALEAEASKIKGGKIESSSKREPRLSRLSLSYGRAEKEKRLKAWEEAKLRRMSRPEVREAMDNQPLQRTVEPSEILTVELTGIEDIPMLLQQREKGMISPCHAVPLDGVGPGAIKENTVFDVASGGLRDCPDKGLESIALGYEGRGPIDNELPLSDMCVLPASPALVPSKGAEPMSLVVDLLPFTGTLTVALGPGPEHLEPWPSAVSATLNLENAPNGQSEQDISSSKHETSLKAETPDEVKPLTCLTGMVAAEADRKSEKPPEVADVNKEGHFLKVGQDVEGNVEDVCLNGEAEEVETLDIQLGTFRSVGDETLDRKGSENVQEESRDGLENGEDQQPFPDYTDSQIDKSEVGSSMDSIEDMSPSSRKNRREPKVPGKFLPLLECLRVICAHKFAPLFRQRQDCQDNAEYDRLVRRHVDLSIVRARLEDGAYSGSVEFFRDLLLIFTNALVYNSSDSPEYAGAKALRSCALTEMDRILRTEALLKQNGPATRKREVRKSMEVHKARVSAISGSGLEVRKKGILKGSSSEMAAALDLQGGGRSAHIGFEDTPHAGKSSNKEESRGLDGRIETVKKLAPNRVVKEEIVPGKEPEFLNDGGGDRSGSGGGSLPAKKVRVDGAAKKTSLHGQAIAGMRGNSGRQSIENINGTKMTSAKMKDVMCIDVEKKGPLNNSSSVVVPSGLPIGKRQQTPPLLRQTSTTRVSRHSKRAGDSPASIPKKRVRK